MVEHYTIRQHIFRKKHNFSGLILMMVGFASILVSGYLGIESLLWVSIAVITVGEGLFDPSYNNILSRAVSENEQGKLQGVNQGLHSSYEMLGPFAAGLIYLYNPLAIYILAALLMIATLLCFYKISRVFVK